MAQSINVRINPRIGATMNGERLDEMGVDCSLTNNLIASAKG